ncbi:hypothetical protein IGI04_019067 [Brassica rapa subsp. trilocularis]|uniref:Uncharacterized protein n=1 Tax=Brassica rapa subsp. trilocularis TaxID=1813537 RepID=A0ABQ7MES2_BRACM|nr:hypothetical protein IGI04_019067 [Brassica rapa subsp. trilocularis]
MYIKLKSEKPAYHIKKRSNGLKIEKTSGKLDRYIFIEHTNVFKSKRLEWVWSVLVWEKGMNFMQQEIYYERETREKTPSEDFLEVVWKTSWKSSGSLLAQKSSRSEKLVFLDLRKPAYQKTFKWVKNKEHEWKIR